MNTPLIEHEKPHLTTISKKNRAMNRQFLLYVMLLLLFFYILTTFRYTAPKMNAFGTLFISILLEALPFVLIGSCISSLIHLFISEEMIQKWIPQNKWVAIFTASLMGFLFPVCECAIVPIVRRLIQKGVPFYVGITFMLAAPIVNPIVLLSTHYAFRDAPYMVLLRGSLGCLAACLIGYLFSFVSKTESPFKKTFGQPVHVLHDPTHGHHHSGCCCSHNHSVSDKKGFQQHFVEMLDHTASEFYDVGKMLIFGALLSAGFKVFISQTTLATVGGNSPLSILIMLGLAFMLSLCSEADAFIARTFMGQFTTGSVVGFLILGPMIDLKNLMMLLGTFKRSLVSKLVASIFAICFLIALFVNFF